MMRRKVTALLLFEVAAISALHALGGMPGFGVRGHHLLSPATRVEDAIASGLRFVALGMAYWLLLSSAVYLAARLADIPAALGAVRWLTLPPIRRLVDGTLAVGLSVGTLVIPTPAMAQQPPPVEQTYIPTPAGFEQPGEPLVGLDGDAFIPPGASIPAPAAPVQEPIQHGLETASAIPTHLLFDRPPDFAHEVAAGENLWSIARDRLSRLTDASPSDSEIAAYWTDLIAANRGRLMSGDPDLIYPGEVLALPVVEP